MQYTHLDVKLTLKPGSTDTNAVKTADNSPAQQFQLLSFLDLSSTLQLYAGLRRVGALPNLQIPAYTALDVSLNWQMTPHFNAALTGQNLTDRRHAEFEDGREIERAAFIKFAWQTR